MTRVAVHEALAIWDAAIAQQDHDLVDGLGVVAQVAPEHGRVITARQVGGRVALLLVNKVRELGRVSQEEDGRVVGDEVPVAVVGAELDGKAPGVARQVVRAGLAADGREADRDGALFALGAKDVELRQVGDRAGALEEAVGAPLLLACTTRSGMRSRSKYESRSMR